MTAKAQATKQAKTPAAPAAVRLPQPPVAVPEREAERPDIAAQLEGAARLGHSLGAISLDSPVPPIIQRQELPEEDEEELQMKREPAAIQRQELPEEEKEEEELQMKPEPTALQRQELPDEDEELQTKLANGVQRQGGGEGFQLDDETAGRINRARGGGQPLEDALQEQMSVSLGHDFSGVRVHTDSEAETLSQELSAKAFTTGPDIFFRQGEYNPGSDSGRELIGHELTHVVQQGTGRVRRGGSSITVRPPCDAFEQEADNWTGRPGGPGYGVQRAAKGSRKLPIPLNHSEKPNSRDHQSVIQRVVYFDSGSTKVKCELKAVQGQLTSLGPDLFRRAQRLFQSPTETISAVDLEDFIANLRVGNYEAELGRIEEERQRARRGSTTEAGRPSTGGWAEEATAPVSTPTEHRALLKKFKADGRSIAKEYGEPWRTLWSLVTSARTHREVHLRRAEGEFMLAKFLLYYKYADEIESILRGTDAATAAALDRLLSYDYGSGYALDNWSADFYGSLAESCSFDNILSTVTNELKDGKSKVEEAVRTAQKIDDKFLEHWFMNDKGFMNNMREHGSPE